jgi:hypothetical protein
MLGLAKTITVIIVGIAFFDAPPTVGAYHLLTIVHSLYKSSTQLFYLLPRTTTEATTLIAAINLKSNECM